MNYLEIQSKDTISTVKNLNNLLSNYQIYYQNLRNFHWNITGKYFFDLHSIFEELYNEAKLNIDEIAERILTLREKPVSTLKKYLEMADLEEIETDSPQEMVKHILQNHKILIQDMREIIQEASAIDDEGTVDLISSFLFSIEKKSWMLDAWLSE